MKHLYQISTPCSLKYYESEFMYEHDTFEKLVERVLAEYLKKVLPIIKEENSKEKFPLLPEFVSTSTLNHFDHEEIFDELMKAEGFTIAQHPFHAAYYIDPDWMYEGDGYVMNLDLKAILYTDDPASA